MAKNTQKTHPTHTLFPTQIEELCRERVIAFVAPFRYTAPIWAILIGIIVFEEIPDQLALLGALIVVGTGIYSFYRERQLAQGES